MWPGELLPSELQLGSQRAAPAGAFVECCHGHPHRLLHCGWPGNRRKERAWVHVRNFSTSVIFSVLKKKWKLNSKETKSVTCLTNWRGPLNSRYWLQKCFSPVSFPMNLLSLSLFFFPSKVNQMITFSMSYFQPFGGHSPIIITHVILDLYSP